MKKRKRKFAFLEPFFGGSHKDFAEGLVAHSSHQIDLFTLPDRFWKWRMRGAALYFYNEISHLVDYDGIITTDLMSLSDLKTLCGSSCPPCLVYFHENQLTYPPAPGEKMDMQYGFTDITTCLAADRILFNSGYHLNAFIAGLPAFIGKMPEYKPLWVVDKIREKADVCYPGCHVPAGEFEIPEPAGNSPIIIWNHRWEFDKNPRDFFDALKRVKQKGVVFHIALLGQVFNDVPVEFHEAQEYFGDTIIRYGHVKSKADYVKWLQRGSVVVSTALQENFGISMVEAMRYGCLPLAPCRLSYPEIIPSDFHKDFIYNSQDELISKLEDIILNYSTCLEKRRSVSDAMKCFSWENRVGQFDMELDRLLIFDKNKK